MNIALGLHDFSIVNNRLQWLFNLKQQFPDFKVSLFTVPIDEHQDWGPYRIREEYLKEIRKCLGWIQLIPHGLTHKGSEMQSLSYEETLIMLKNIEEAFEKDSLPFEKGLCAPHWRWNKDVVQALNKMGWWGSVDRRQSKMLKTSKFYQYSHTLDEEWPMADLKLHGHIYGTKNDLGFCFDKLMALPKDTKWHFVTDYLEHETI